MRFTTAARVPLEVHLGRARPALEVHGHLHQDPIAAGQPDARHAGPQRPADVREPDERRPVPGVDLPQERVLVDLPRLLHLHAVELDVDAVEVVRGDPAHHVLEQRGRDRGGEMALGGRPLQDLRIALRGGEEPLRGAATPRAAGARRAAPAPPWRTATRRPPAASGWRPPGAGAAASNDAAMEIHSRPLKALTSTRVSRRGSVVASMRTGPVVDGRHLDGVLVPDRDLQARRQRGERREAAPCPGAPPACPRRAACPPPRRAARRRRSG